MKLKQGDRMICPYCHEEQDGNVEDFVVPRKTGPDSACEDQCIECYEDFVVEHIGGTLYEVREIDSD